MLEGSYVVHDFIVEPLPLWLGNRLRFSYYSDGELCVDLSASSKGKTNKFFFSLYSSLENAVH
jgi:hypothetical protein